MLAILRLVWLLTICVASLLSATSATTLSYALYGAGYNFSTYGGSCPASLLLATGTVNTTLSGPGAPVYASDCIPLPQLAANGVSSGFVQCNFVDPSQNVFFLFSNSTCDSNSIGLLKGSSGKCLWTNPIVVNLSGILSCSNSALGRTGLSLPLVLLTVLASFLI